MTMNSNEKTQKIRSERAKLGQKRRELSLTDNEFKKVKVFIKKLRNKVEKRI